MAHSREEVEKAFAHQQRISEAQDWNAYADLFSEDGVYVEHQFGRFEGPEAVREWLVPIMAPLVDAGWEYPMDWYVIEGDRVVFRWRNVLPNPDGRAEPYEFAGITILEYAGDDKWKFQEDFYNFVETERVLAEWAAAAGKPAVDMPT